MFSQEEMDPYFEGKTCQTYSSDYSYADCDADYVRKKIDGICGSSFNPIWLSFNDSSYPGMNVASIYLYLIEFIGDLTMKKWSACSDDFIEGQDESSCLPPCQRTRFRTILMEKTDPQEGKPYVSLSILEKYV